MYAATLLANSTLSALIAELTRTKNALNTPTLVERTGRALNLIQRELKRLTAVQLVHTQRQGKAKLYTWNHQHPWSKAIHTLLHTSYEAADPADGLHLSLPHRLAHAAQLTQQAETLSRIARYPAFTQSFSSWKHYEQWKTQQEHPWLI